jgi:hypothetical protein
VALVNTKLGTFKVHFVSQKFGLYYRLFIAPSGKIVAFEDMEDAPNSWKFLCSLQIDRSAVTWLKT